MENGMSPHTECAGTTVAHWSISRGFITVLKKMLVKISPNLRDDRNKTLLEVACDWRNGDIISLLIEFGADQDIHIPPDPFVDPKSGLSVGNLYSLSCRYSGSWPRPPCCYCDSMDDPFIERNEPDVAILGKRGQIHLIVCKKCAYSVTRRCTDYLP